MGVAMSETRKGNTFTTSQKVAILRPDEVTNLFNSPNPPGRTSPWSLLSF
jgi:hypothetical protein